MIASRGIILLLIMGSLSGCVSPPEYVKMTMLPLDGQKVTYDNGRKTLVSVKKNFVSLAPYHEINLANGKTSYLIFVNDLESKPVSVSIDNIDISFIEDVMPVNDEHSNSKSSHSLKDEANTFTVSQTPVPIKIEPYDEIMIEISEEENRERGIAYRLLASSNEQAEEDATSTTDSHMSGSSNSTYNAVSTGLINNQFDRIDYSGTSRGEISADSHSTTYDPYKARVMAQANLEQFQSNVSDISTHMQSLRAKVDALYLKSQTIQPNQAYGGLVVSDTRMLDKNRIGTFLVDVIIDGEEYKFKVKRDYYAREHHSNFDFYDQMQGLRPQRVPIL